MKSIQTPRDDVVMRLIAPALGPPTTTTKRVCREIRSVIGRTFEAFANEVIICEYIWNVCALYEQTIKIESFFSFSLDRKIKQRLEKSCVSKIAHWNRSGTHSFGVLFGIQIHSLIIITFFHILRRHCGPIETVETRKRKSNRLEWKVVNEWKGKIASMPSTYRPSESETTRRRQFSFMKSMWGEHMQTECK